MKKSKKQMLADILSPDQLGWVRNWADKGETLRVRILKRAAIAERDYPQINTVDLVEFVDEKRREIRFGYYTTNRHGEWCWGQYCPCYRQQDLRRLLKEARKNGIF